MTDQRTLVFSKLETYFHPETHVVMFKGNDGKSPITCGISLPALQDHFDIDAKQHPLQTFKANQTVILHIAKKKYLEEKLEANGMILIKTEDLGTGQ